MLTEDELRGGSAPNFTFEEIMGMRVAELRDIADEYDLDTEGMRKNEIRSYIIDELGIVSSVIENPDDVPF